MLRALDAELLAANECWFGGGTAIVLTHGEYRESADIDFLASSLEGYGALRRQLTGPAGQKALGALRQVTALRADQYGVRTMLSVGGSELKFEIVFEGRIALDTPGPGDRVCGVATLTQLDLVASRLLANSDRWADDAVFSRDLIDLAMLELPRPRLRLAVEKAAAAYGQSVERDLARAVQRMAARRGRLDDCMTGLKMDRVPKAVLWKNIRRLRPTARRSW